MSENPGQALLSVDIAGDIIVGVDRFVEVPEKWQREEREREQAVFMASAIGGGCLILVIIAITIYAIIRNIDIIKIILVYLKDKLIGK